MVAISSNTLVVPFQGYLKKELGEGTVNLMKQIKNTIDPKGIMNPGSK